MFSKEFQLLVVGVGYKNESFQTYLGTNLIEAEFCSEQESEKKIEIRRSIRRALPFE